MSGVPDPDVVIDVRQAPVTRGGKDLIRDVDWRVELDERWVVLGPNGAGKTTLLNLAAARLHPTRGTVDVLGERLGRVDVFELRTRIGLATVALHDRMPPEETVLDAVMTAAWSVVGRYRESYDTLDVRRARALLGQLGVGGLADRVYGTLSEGERKRVQIARALMTDPELLLLDEPAAWPSWPPIRTHRRWSSSRITSRRSRPGSATRCCCARVAWSPRAWSPRRSPASTSRRPSICRCAWTTWTAGSPPARHEDRGRRQREHGPRHHRAHPAPSGGDRARRRVHPGTRRKGRQPGDRGGPGRRRGGDRRRDRFGRVRGQPARAAVRVHSGHLAAPGGVRGVRRRAHRRRRDRRERDRRRARRQRRADRAGCGGPR